jgi:hypothetical protein
MAKKKVKTLFMASYKGETNAPYFVGADGTQYSPDIYTEMCNSAEFEAIESVVGLQVHAERATLREGWVRDPRWTKKDLQRGAKIANDALAARMKAGFIAMGMTAEQAALASRDPATNIDTELAGRGAALRERLGVK